MNATAVNEGGGVARIHAAIAHNERNQQYAMFQTPTDYQGNEFKLLIDSGATHSFISPSCVSKLQLKSFRDSTLTVELATGKTTQSLQSVGNIKFKLGGFNTQAIF